jgi:predicted nucleotidyltransferase
MKIKDLEKEIVKRLSCGDIEKVILFGSYAWGEPQKYSDVDLYVVTKDNFIPKTWEEKSQIYLKVAKYLDDLRSKVPIDLIVHTKEMHERFLKMNNSFCRKIMKEGKRLL